MQGVNTADIAVGNNETSANEWNFEPIGTSGPTDPSAVISAVLKLVGRKVNSLETQRGDVPVQTLGTTLSGQGVN